MAESCDEPQYKTLITALCNEHQIPLIRVDSNKKLGEWSGLCKIDKEGKPRKVCGCSVVVIKVSLYSFFFLQEIEHFSKYCLLLLKDFGEESPALDIIKDHLRAN